MTSIREKNTDIYKNTNWQNNMCVCPARSYFSEKYNTTSIVVKTHTHAICITQF